MHFQRAVHCFWAWQEVILRQGGVEQGRNRWQLLKTGTGARRPVARLVPLMWGKGINFPTEAPAAVLGWSGRHQAPAALPEVEQHRIGLLVPISHPLACALNPIVFSGICVQERLCKLVAETYYHPSQGSCLLFLFHLAVFSNLHLLMSLAHFPQQRGTAPWSVAGKLITTLLRLIDLAAQISQQTWTDQKSLA